MATTNNLLQIVDLAAGKATFVELPIRAGSCGAHLVWLDATSAATITLSFSSRAGASVNDPAALWADSGLTLTGPGGTAAGSLMINATNVQQQRARVGITATAATHLEIWDGTAP